MGSYTLRYLGKYEKIAHNLISKLSLSVPNSECFNLCGVRNRQMEIFLANNVSQNKIQIKKKVKSQIQG